MERTTGSADEAHRNVIRLWQLHFIRKQCTRSTLRSPMGEVSSPVSLLLSFAGSSESESRVEHTFDLMNIHRLTRGEGRRLLCAR
jgi:hypothetical protein